MGSAWPWPTASPAYPAGPSRSSLASTTALCHRERPRQSGHSPAAAEPCHVPTPGISAGHRAFAGFGRHEAEAGSEINAFLLPVPFFAHSWYDKGRKLCGRDLYDHSGTASALQPHHAGGPHRHCRHPAGGGAGRVGASPKTASSCRSRTRNTSFCSSSCATPNRCSAARTSTS